MPISILIYLKLNDDEGTHTNAVAKITHSPQLCHVLNNQNPWGKKVQISRNSKYLPNIPYLNHAGGEADDLLEERGDSQG